MAPIGDTYFEYKTTSFFNLVIEVKYNGFLVAKQSAVVSSKIQY